MPMPPRHREEVLNTILASQMAAHGADADPETILAAGRAKPDVMLQLRGLRCAVEGKVADVQDARGVVLGDARRRIDEGIAHLAVAVVYPKELRTTLINRLPGEMEAVQLDFAVLTEAGDGLWHAGTIADILGELRHAHEIVVRDDVLQQAVATLNLGLAVVADALFSSGSTCDRLIDLLGVGTEAHAPATV
jgi:hypothetical protein